MTISKQDIEDLKKEVGKFLPGWISVDRKRNTMTLEFKAVIEATTSRALTDCVEVLVNDERNVGRFSKEIQQQLSSELNSFFVEQHENFGVYGPKPEVEYEKAISALKEELYSGGCQFIEGSPSVDASKVGHAEAVDALNTIEEYLNQRE
jgi:hypothetical protein